MKSTANRLAYFLGEDIKLLTIVCKDKQIIFNPKEDTIYFTDDSLCLVGDKREIELKYDEIIDVVR